MLFLNIGVAEPMRGHKPERKHCSCKLARQRQHYVLLALQLVFFRWPPLRNAACRQKAVRSAFVYGLGRQGVPCRTAQAQSKKRPGSRTCCSLALRSLLLSYTCSPREDADPPTAQPLSLHELHQPKPAKAKSLRALLVYQLRVLSTWNHVRASGRLVKSCTCLTAEFDVFGCSPVGQRFTDCE